ncbi:hypothetical protein EW145_g5441 [Phellinidium pouzarii]|uniref:BAG domain-containing protein n=1 Tax=Phellinidium pouzarii TaxID=167371 RepID=A0A4S4L049_9AGAM|nr:hypothetical protein EW145_g5441 [Phellinidium pouzarii]
MKDDNAPLTSYGVHPGSVIALIGGAGGAPAPAMKEKAKQATEEGTIAVICDELSHVQTSVVPALDAFLGTICPPPPSVASPATTSTATSTAAAPSPASIPVTPSVAIAEQGTTLDLDMEHRRLEEELLQALLRLDVLALDGAWTAARAERKGAVKTVQNLLDRLDGGWRESKERAKQIVQ